MDQDLMGFGTVPNLACYSVGNLAASVAETCT